ncbi:MAG: glutathione S-transferase family protein [Pseudomonadota bacterium]
MTRYLLHYAPDNASLVIRLAMGELGLPFETCLVDRSVDEQKSAAYRRLNPNGLIPVLETEDGPIFETAGILLWLVDQHGELGPQIGEPERGRFLSWLFFVSNTLHPALRMLFYAPNYIGEDRAHQAQLTTVASGEAAQYFSMLDREAARSDAVFGAGTVTVLDFYIAACLRWAQLYPVASPHLSRFASQNWPNLHSMAQRLEDRPNVTAWRQAEGVAALPFTAPDYPDPPEGSAL